MQEETYVTTLPDGGTFRCVKSQLEKTGGVCPVHKVMVYPEMKERFLTIAKAKADKMAKALDDHKKLYGVE